MSFLHVDEWIGPEDSVVVNLDHRARVMLMDDLNFSAYRQGRPFRAVGGWQGASPVRLTPPHQGRWHAVVDLEGRSGRVRAGVQIARA